MIKWLRERIRDFVMRNPTWEYDNGWSFECSRGRFFTTGDDQHDYYKSGVKGLFTITETCSEWIDLYIRDFHIVEVK